MPHQIMGGLALLAALGILLLILIAFCLRLLLRIDRRLRESPPAAGTRADHAQTRADPPA